MRFTTTAKLIATAIKAVICEAPAHRYEHKYVLETTPSTVSIRDFGGIITAVRLDIPVDEIHRPLKVEDLGELLLGLCGFDPDELLVFSVPSQDGQQTQLTIARLSDRDQIFTMPVSLIASEDEIMPLAFKEIIDAFDNHRNENAKKIRKLRCWKRLEEYVEEIHVHRQYTATEKPEGDKFVKAFAIKRCELLEATKVINAVGHQKYRNEFLYWCLRVYRGGYRSICGDGARFICFEKQGPELIAAANPSHILVRKDYFKQLIGMLKAIDAEYVIIRETADAEHILFAVGNLTLMLPGPGPMINWPDENMFLNRESPYRIVSPIHNWKLATKSIMSTITREFERRHEPHVAELLFDLENRVAVASSKTNNYTSKIVPLTDVKIEGDRPKMLTFPCISGFLEDMVRKGKRDCNIQMEFVNDRAPVVVRYGVGTVVEESQAIWERDPETLTRERLIMFFASFYIDSPPSRDASPPAANQPSETVQVGQSSATATEAAKPVASVTEPENQA